MQASPSFEVRMGVCVMECVSESAGANVCELARRIMRTSGQDCVPQQIDGTHI
jgi:hypothetical protein